MSGKWTPGPWSLGPYRGKTRRHIDGPLWSNLAKVVTRMADDTAECAEGLANARLIAAAPDLYAALERALNFIANTESEMGETLPCGDDARAALAKARGEA